MIIQYHSEYYVPHNLFLTSQMLLLAPWFKVRHYPPGISSFALTSLQLKLIIIKSFYPPIFDSNLGADTHQTGRRASAAGAGKRAAQRTRASRLAQRTRASRLAQRTRTSARATITILGDELTHFSLSHVNPKYSESCSIFYYTCPLSLPPREGSTGSSCRRNHISNCQSACGCHLLFCSKNHLNHKFMTSIFLRQWSFNNFLWFMSWVNFYCFSFLFFFLVYFLSIPSTMLAYFVPSFCQCFPANISQIFPGFSRLLPGASDSPEVFLS